MSIIENIRNTAVTPTQKIDEWFKMNGFQPTKIQRNPCTAVLYENAIKIEKSSILSSAGALVAFSGEKTGRSPQDKRIVDSSSVREDVWWGPVNQPLSNASYTLLRNIAIKYLESCSQVYVIDAFAGWATEHRLRIRVVCARAYHALFMQNMLIRPSPEELKDFGTPDFTIYNAGECDAPVGIPNVTSKTSVSLNFDAREMIILGTQYAGEMKKGIFTVMNYYMPKKGILSLHSSANEGTLKKDVTLFFGLSGTGKTTLSADPHRQLIGDDEHCWSQKGVFNIEGGCYAKCIDLEREKEPEIFDAIRYATVLENVKVDPLTRQVDYRDRTLTENTRAAYPIEHIGHAKQPCIGPHPKNIIMLTCDAFGVLPPVAKLTLPQAMYHFMSGYTAKIAGTEVGISEPTATFSACFGQPFLVWHPVVYARLLAGKLKEHAADVWLVNTGWAGGPYGKGQRMPLSYSRAIIDAIHSGELAHRMETDKEYDLFPIFNLKIPRCVTGVPSTLLNPAIAWPSGDQETLFSTALHRLATLFSQNFASFVSETDEEIVAAGPSTTLTQ